MRIDHVLIGTLDVDREIKYFADLGMGVNEGLSFGNGVGNMLIPLAGTQQYLEILTVEGEGEGADWLLGELAKGRRYIGWAIEVESLEEVAERLDRPIEDNAAGDSGQAQWRSVENSSPGSFLPFFISYPWTGGGDLAWPERWAAWLAKAAHRVSPLEITGLELVGDPEELQSWIGGDLPVAVRPGEPARLDAVRIRTDEGEILLPEYAAPTVSP